MNDDTSGIALMGKKQKNALLDEGLCQLTDQLQALGGATFPRIVTAALLQYMFNGFSDSDSENVPGPEPMWMKLAVGLEREDFTIDEIPGKLLESSMEFAQSRIAYWDRQPPSEPQKAKLKEWRSIHRGFHKMNRHWKNTVDHFGGARKALQYVFEGRFAKPRE